jgi:hypothetical protein
LKTNAGVSIADWFSFLRAVRFVDERDETRDAMSEARL